MSKLKILLFAVLLHQLLLNTSCYNNSSNLSAKDSIEIINKLEESKRYLLSDKEKAAFIAKGALKTCREKNYNLKAKCYSVVAASQRYHVNMDTLLKNDSDAILFARLSKDSLLLFDAFYNYSYDLLSFNLISEAKDKIILTKNLSESISKDSIKSWQSFVEGVYYFKLQKDLPLAKKLFKESLRLAEKTNNNYLASNCRLWIFNTEMAKGNFDSTIKPAFDALGYFQQHNYKEDIANCKGIIGNGFKNAGHFDKAIEYLSAAIQEAEATKNYITALYASTYLDYVYLSSNKLEAAKKTFFFNNNLAQKLGSPFFTALEFAYEGRYFTLNAKYDTAYLILTNAENLASQVKSHRLLGMIYGMKTEMYAKQNKDIEADSMEVKAYLEIQKSVAPELIDNMYKMANDSGKILSNDAQLEKRLYTDSTFTTSKGTDAIKEMRHGEDTIEIRPIISAFDSSINVKYNDLLLGYETEYKTKQKEDSLQIQKQQAVIAKQNIHQQNLIIVAITITAFLLALGFFLQYKSRQRAVRDKAKIQLLQNEIHHRVKNNLGIINRFVEVAETSGQQSLSLESLRGRVKAIELLHKNLYQNNAAGNISLQTYLEQLTNVISQTLHDEEKNISIYINTPVTTDMQKAEKMGLIINELITNSFKYGFKNKSSGEINLTAKPASDGRFTLQVKDNGEGYNQQTVKKGYGSKLIEGLAYELNGSFSINTNNGVSFTLTA